ncbi:hypothetical protein [Chryseobacterium viscerum]|uniref:Uncharacterized protein n=1 Tax=Chryseobacterium viscerum TaxID=1037377 RepID=A0A316WEA4_9FLAO|nr:hypothetical protein [Chryseobacterium viscerum]PWN58416.1 hypothetical protein C1634_022970 [Chryseobacterium viscerum]
MKTNERINELKELKKIANNYLEKYKDLRFDKNKRWIGKKSEISIEQLKEIIQKINHDRHPDQVELYCNLKSKFEDGNISTQELSEFFNVTLMQIQTGSIIFDIARLSPESNLLLDIAWLTDGYVKDYIDIYLKRKDISILEKFLPSKITEITDRILPVLKCDKEFREIISVIEVAVESSNNNSFITSNILFITACESLVRLLSRRIYQNQNPSLNDDEINEYIYNKFTSLESLITKGKWLSDFPIKFSEALVHYKDVNDNSLNQLRKKHKTHVSAQKRIEKRLSKFNKDTITESEISDLVENLKNDSSELMTDEDKEIKINLSVMLNFLVRKYKDDRNQIIHGNFKDYNLKWKNYINVAAIVKIFDVFTEYEKFYNSKKNNA